MPDGAIRRASSLPPATVYTVTLKSVVQQCDDGVPPKDER
jgi:hypothetical protein